MPEAPQEIIPEKEIPVVSPKEPEAPPVTGTFHPTLMLREEISPPSLGKILVSCSSITEV